MPLPLLSLYDHTNLWNTALVTYYDIYLCDYLTSSHNTVGQVELFQMRKLRLMRGK